MDIIQLIEDATSELLLVPHWQANMDISDQLASGRRDMCVCEWATDIVSNLSYTRSPSSVQFVCFCWRLAKEAFEP